MFVKDLMSSYITSVKPEDPVSAVIACMRSENVGMVPVCDAQSHLLGVITDRDVIMRDGFAKTAGEIMTTQPVTTAPREELRDAAMKFSEFAVHRLPVVENERLVGMLSLRDLAKKRAVYRGARAHPLRHQQPLSAPAAHLLHFIVFLRILASFPAPRSSTQNDSWRLFPESRSDRLRQSTLCSNRCHADPWRSASRSPH